jgi:multicomponent Na+:H+ antiporter subunit D
MDYLPPLPVVLPMAMAAFLMATSSFLSRRFRDSLSLLTGLAVVLVCGLLLAQSRHGTIVYWFGGWTPRDGIALGIAFVIDPLGAGMALLMAVNVTLALVFSWRFFHEIGALYPSLMLVFMGAMTGFCLTGDLFNMFVFFELMSVAAFALTAYKIEEEAALMGGFSFAVTNSVGAFMILTGIGLVYGRTGALDLAQLGTAISLGPPDGLVIVALTLITCGFGIKAALVPFQFWLADAHAVAPSPVCSIFSGVMVELGLFAVARVYWTVFAGVLGDNQAIVRDIWLGLGVMTALVGGIMCFAERHLKRLLAFSTVSHSGLFLIGVALLSPTGLAGTSLYVLGHGLVKASLFLATGILLNPFGSVDANELRGKGKRFPGLAALFLCGGLGLSGLPPFGTWLGKSLIEEGAGQAGYGWLSWVLLISSMLTGGAVLRAAGSVFFALGPPQNEDASTPKREDKETQENYDRPPMVMFVPTATLLVLAVAVGLWPGLGEEAERASSRFIDWRGYVAAVLGGIDHPRLPLQLETGKGLPGVMSGLGAAAGAAILALVALYSRRIPQGVRDIVWRIGKPIISALRSLHSGQISDYVNWVVIGVAVVGAVLVCSFHH